MMVLFKNKVDLIALKKIGGVFGMPVAELLFSFVLRNSVALLDLAEQLLALAGNDVQVIVGQLAPLLLDFAFELHPVAFYFVVVHGVVLKMLKNQLGLESKTGKT